MFGSKNVPVTVTAFPGVHLKAKRQSDDSKIMDFNFETPATREVLEDINPKLPGVFFDNRGKPRELVKTVALDIKPGLQKVSIRATIRSAIIGEVEGVTFKRIRVVRADGDTWMLTWGASVLISEEVMVSLTRALRETVYLTCVRQDPPLPDEDEEGDEESGDDALGEDGQPPRPRRRRRKAEQEELPSE